MRRIDPRLLGAIGVRFVITDMPFDGLELRGKVDVPVTDRELQELGISNHIPSFSLYLYELSGSNLGQFSPTDMRLEQTASDTLERLADPKLDPSRTLITNEHLQGPLTPATLRAFLVGRGQFMVRAESVGHSVLLLPLEFSHCLSVTPLGSDTARVRLFRADLLLTGIYFENNLDVSIKYRNGPLWNARCRLDDLADMAIIKIGDAFKLKPELVPTRMITH